MTLSIIRTYGVNYRFRYSLLRDGVFVRKIVSDTEAMFAVVSPGLSIQLRRTASEISQAEIEDGDTHIVPVVIK